MPVLWTPDFSIGISKLDVQHRELINRINLLSEACNRGKGRAEIIATVAFLEEYVNSHFASEEKLMKETNYDGSVDHKEKHAQFKKNFSLIKKQLAEEGPGIHIIIQTNHMIVNWLTNHIRTFDRDLGSFVQTQRSCRTS